MTSPAADRREELHALLVAARPELHRYASRMLGSSFDGEDIVQDVAERALKFLADLAPDAPLRPWLFRIAHNRTLDVLRGRATRSTLPASNEIEQVPETPQQAMERSEIVGLALRRFGRLPVTPRSVLILKDVLELSLDEIVDTLGLTLPTVKAALHRARQAIRKEGATADSDSARAGPETRLYAELFNKGDWDGLTALLAREVRVFQHARAVLRGPTQARGTFFEIYSRVHDCKLKPARAEGRDVLAALDPATGALLYVTRVDWRDGAIVEIHDYRHARYVLDGLVVDCAS